MIRIGDAKPVLGVVRPHAASSEAAVAAVAAESVVVEKASVQEQAMSEPAETPAPAKTQAEASKEAAQETGRVEPESVTDPRIPQRGVVAVERRSPDVGRIITRNIDDLRIGGLNVNGGLAILRLRGDPLLRRGLEAAVALRPAAHSLDGGHNVSLLGEEGVAQVRGPAHVAIEHGHYVGKRDHGLDAGVPVLLLGGVHQLLAAQIAMVLKPLLELDDFERVGGGSEHLREKRVGIQCDRSYQIIQVLRGQKLRLSGRRRGRLGFGLRHPKTCQAGEDQNHYCLLHQPLCSCAGHK